MSLRHRFTRLVLCAMVVIGAVMPAAPAYAANDLCVVLVGNRVCVY